VGRKGEGTSFLDELVNNRFGIPTREKEMGYLSILEGAVILDGERLSPLLQRKGDI